jgi:hypothetical protein
MSMFPAIRGSPDALSERVEISQKGCHNVTSDFDADVQMAFSISIIDFSSGDSIEAYVLGPGNLTYGELMVNSTLGVEAFRTDISGNYSLIVYNPGNESLDIRYFLGPTIGPTASLAFGAGILLTLGGIVAFIVGVVFAVIGRKS